MVMGLMAPIRQIIFLELTMNPFMHSTLVKPLCKKIDKKKFWRSQNKYKAFRIISSAAIIASTLMPTVSHAVDLNQASLQDLLELKGIGPKTAQMIIDERERGGQFDSIEDLSDRVKGIGPKKADNLIKSGLVVNKPKKED